MLYYLGKGTEFKKEDCKEYKTIEGALKAAAKNEELVVWDENGNVIGSLTDNVPEGALETNPDGSVFQSALPRGERQQFSPKSSLLS